MTGNKEENYYVIFQAMDMWREYILNIENNGNLSWYLVLKQGCSIVNQEISWAKEREWNGWVIYKERKQMIMEEIKKSKLYNWK